MTYLVSGGGGATPCIVRCNRNSAKLQMWRVGPGSRWKSLANAETDVERHRGEVGGDSFVSRAGEASRAAVGR